MRVSSLPGPCTRVYVNYCARERSRGVFPMLVRLNGKGAIMDRLSPEGLDVPFGDAQGEPDVTIDKIPNSPLALGMVCQFVARFPPFRDYTFGPTLHKLEYQLATGSHLIAGLDDRIVAYLGWVTTSREAAEAWIREEVSLRDVPESADAIAVTFLVTEHKRYILPMIRHFKRLNPGRSFYWKRHFLDGRVVQRTVRK